jgi:hypothetical protein
MNPITLLTTSLDSLWLWTYGLVAGWGLTFTMVVIALAITLIRTVHLQERISRLESRVIANDRDTSIRLNKLEKDKP